MNKEIYEVDRNEYVGLIGEMKTSCFDMIKEYQENDIIIKLVNKTTNKIMTERIIHDDQSEQYYIYELPNDTERQPPKKIRQYILESKEEVQAFFDILNKLQKEKHDRTLP